MSCSDCRCHAYLPVDTGLFTARAARAPALAPTGNLSELGTSLGFLDIQSVSEE